MIKAYPKIVHLGTRYCDGIFDGPVEITEKIDGSQFVFGRIGGELFVRSKRKEMPIDSPEKMFARAVEQVLRFESKIPDDRVFYGEYLQKPKHNVLAYERVPHNHLMLFGISNGERDWMQSVSAELGYWADTFDIEPIPILGGGRWDAAQVMEIVTEQARESTLGGVPPEGVVVKRYGDCTIGGQIYPVMTAKFVSEKFKERANATWKREHTGKGKWETFVESFRTEARWQKAVQHLRDDGVLEGEPKDIGALIKEVHRDILEEHGEEIRDYLFATFKQELIRRSTAGLPEWYKEQLALGEIAA